MNKAEDLAKAFLKKLVSHTTLYKGTIDELEVYESDDVIWAYKEGYHQAEKDLELTWEDMLIIHKCIKDAMNFKLYKMMEGVDGQKEVYEEVLKRFNKQKGVRNECINYFAQTFDREDSLWREEV